MALNYIGSKKTLAPLLVERMCAHWPDHREWNLLDAFAGTGAFAVHACDKFDSIFVNDWELYSYLVLGAQFDPPDPKPDLPESRSVEGHISAVYGPPERMYFTAQNAQLIDGFRASIRPYEQRARDYLTACLLCAADHVANVASVYGAYLKQFKRSASVVMDVRHVPKAERRARVTRMNARDVVATVPSKTIVYLDPPYNQRQYGANYFPLNVIAELDEDIPVKGITGLPTTGYLKSEWCSKKTARDALTELLVATPCRRVAMSYNDDGIMSQRDIQEIFEELGCSVTLAEIPYRRFKAGKYTDENPETVEYLFLASKDFLSPL